MMGIRYERKDNKSDHLKPDQFLERSRAKRGYHSMSEKHMWRYVDEFTFRLNGGNCRYPTVNRLEALVRDSVIEIDRFRRSCLNQRNYGETTTRVWLYFSTDFCIYRLIGSQLHGYGRLLPIRRAVINLSASTVLMKSDQHPENRQVKINDYLG